MTDETRVLSDLRGTPLPFPRSDVPGARLTLTVLALQLPPLSTLPLTLHAQDGSGGVQTGVPCDSLTQDSSRLGL